MDRPVNQHEDIDPDSVEPLIMLCWNDELQTTTVMYRENRLSLLTDVEFSDFCTAITDLALEVAPFVIPDVLDMTEDD